jgi:delta 1-pyrroline-5-carboxylate dehydrogenase
MGWLSDVFVDVPILGTVASVLEEVMTSNLGRAGVEAAGAVFGGSGGSGTGKAGGSGFVAQENPILTAARSQAMRDISQGVTRMHTSQRARSPGTHSNAHSRAIMSGFNQHSLDKMYSRINSYASKSTSRISLKSRSTG